MYTNAANMVTILSSGYLLATIILISTTATSSLARQLASLNLSDVSDATIRRVALQDQINYHRPVLKSLQTRQTKSLDGLYNLCFDPQRQGFSKNWSSVSLKLACPPEDLFQMPVPSAFNSVPSTSRAKNYMGWLWYQKTFTLYKQELEHGQMLLHFESINYLALVWVQPINGLPILLGSHVGGHLPFMVNITSQLKGGPTEFRLTIAVSNKLDDDSIPSGRMVDLSKEIGLPYERFEPDFDFFHFSGILGSINLVKLPPIFLESVEMKTWTNYTSEKRYTIEFEICLNREFSSSSPVVHTLLTIYNPYESKAESTKTNTTQLDKGSTNCHTISLDLKYDSMQTWKLANGNINHLSALYLVRAKLLLAPNLCNDCQIDSYEVREGFQSNEYSRELGYSFQIQGFGLHQEQSFSGRTMSLAAVMKDIYLLKQMGVNVIRTSHYPYSSQFLDACDQHGIFVIAECPAVGLNSFSDTKLELHKQMLLEMIERDHHHPSVLMWSIANEPASQLHEAKAYFESLTKYARAGDLGKYTSKSGRPLTAAIAQPEDVDLIGQTLDAVMVNRYMGWYEATGVVEAARKPLLDTLCGWSKRLPNKALLVSEFGAEAYDGLHRWSPRDIYSEEYQSELLIEHEKLFDELWAASAYNSHNLTTDGRQVDGASNNTVTGCSENINFLGSMIWNFADFSTHPSLTRIGALNRKGVFTKDREPKLAASTIREIYLKRLRGGASLKAPPRGGARGANSIEQAS